MQLCIGMPSGEYAATTPCLCLKCLRWYVAELERELGIQSLPPVEEILRLREPFSLLRIVEILLGASTVLYDRGWDGHGHEVVKQARDAAQEWLHLMAPADYPGPSNKLIDILGRAGLLKDPLTDPSA
jgi:hypothetical protein